MWQREIWTPEQLNVAISAGALRKRAVTALVELVKGLERERSSPR